MKLGANALTSSGVNRVPLASQLAFDVKVKNGGDSEETDVGVTIAISGAKKITVNQTIPRIANGQSATISIPITQKPDTKSVNTVTVSIAAVPGEKNTTNNKGSFPAIFSP